ncbi:hypothetical protein LCGC14_0550400 [marine sediment metagenome]|uniref:Big-1 domain-containing protein n=1 Tax=marine sediment metagenome TaxID=412755 RepID=A0A0F9UBI5_9ZZZZ
MAENIKLISGQQVNFTIDDGYFYTLDSAQDNLLVKTDDGNTAFSYPFDTLMSNTITSSEFDGVYFWALEDSGTNDMTIRRWQLENYVCKLRTTHDFTETGSHKYQSGAFSVEHYHDTFYEDTTSGSNTILLITYSGTSMLDFTTTVGDGLTLHLGPNTNGEEEDVVVTGTVAGGVTISGTTLYSYLTGNEINFYTYIWMFNNYNGLSATGALYKFDAYTGVYITKYGSGAYSSVGAATFYNVNSFTELGDVDTLMYVKGTNILFVNTGAAGATLPYYGSMVLENIMQNETTVIPVQDIATYDQNIYRLQLTEDGASGAWSTYNYDLSSFDAFIASISVSAAPALIAANGISTSTITAIVKDQFLQPVTARAVYFTVTSAGGGSIPAPPVNTDSTGKATKIYSSGTSASEPKITARSEQT